MVAVDVDLTVDDLNVDILAEHHVVEQLVSEGAALQARIKLLDVVDVTLRQVYRVTTGAEVHVAVENTYSDVSVHVGTQLGLISENVEEGRQH